MGVLDVIAEKRGEGVAYMMEAFASQVAYMESKNTKT